MSIALKFTSLFIRTLAKPIANQIKSQAREHPSFRKKCIKVAQAIHRTEAMLRLRLLNESKDKIKPLNDAKAIQSGANFVAESFVFAVAGSMIFYESWRSRRKELKRQASVADDIRLLQDEISWIKDKLEQKTIIAHGETVPIPEDLKPLILQTIAQHTEGQQAQDQQAQGQQLQDSLKDTALVKLSSESQNREAHGSTQPSTQSSSQSSSQSSTQSSTKSP